MRAQIIFGFSVIRSTGPDPFVYLFLAELPVSPELVPRHAALCKPAIDALSNNAEILRNLTNGQPTVFHLLLLRNLTVEVRYEECCRLGEMHIATPPAPFHHSSVIIAERLSPCHLRAPIDYDCV